MRRMICDDECNQDADSIAMIVSELHHFSFWECVKAGDDRLKEGYDHYIEILEKLL